MERNKVIFFDVPAGSQVQKVLGRERTLVRYTLAK